MKCESIVVGGGCFWCLEAVFLEVDGVVEVESGYAGGSVANPDYDSVCSGRTGHAEVVRLVFDSDRLPLADLLAIFFAIHDPTTPDRQGHDVGSQYRSIILTANESQRDTARQVIAALVASDGFDDPLVTEVVPLDAFYPAEADHRRYYEQHPAQGYCRAVIAPKLSAFRREFAARRRPTSPVGR
ncbi:MAG: peptide-methionine (S)-S-oxide reductase MsrA [Burkholderiaceae bacterium]